MLWYTRHIYRTLARRAADEIQDYQTAGFSVLGVIGVDASPSCGVGQSLKMREALELVGRLTKETATPEEVNAIISRTVIAGRGLYIELLQGELGKRGVSIPFAAHDLIAELEGKQSSVNVQAMLPKEL